MLNLRGQINRKHRNFYLDVRRGERREERGGRGNRE
jgi:hypothetical protein